MNAYDLIAQELELLPGTKPKSIFGHKGYGIGSSVYAFLDDDDSLVIKTDKYPTEDSTPKGLSHFYPGGTMSKTWIRIPFTEDLAMIRRHWSLVEESYEHAALRDKLKKKKGK